MLRDYKGNIDWFPFVLLGGLLVLIAGVSYFLFMLYMRPADQNPTTYDQPGIHSRRYMGRGISKYELDDGMTCYTFNSDGISCGKTVK